MTGVFYLDYVSVGHTVEIPTVRGRILPAAMMHIAKQALPNDSIGFATLRLTGLVPGTEVHLYQTEDDAEIGGTEGTIGSTFTLSYGYRAVPHTAYLTIIKPGYRWRRIDGLSLTAAGISIPVFQEADLVYSNPA